MTTARPRIERHASLPSTSDRAIALAEEGEGAWTAVLADEQTAGRGRHGRAWASPPGNLHLSVVLDAAATAAPSGLGLLAGVAMAEAVAPLVPPGAPLHLKWPNDLLAGGRKLGGVLVEAGYRRDGAAWAVAGIGINLVAHPEDAERPAVSLASLGADPPAPEALATVLIERLMHWSARARAEGFAPVLAAWQRRAQPRGAAITVRLPSGPVSGRYAGLDDDGALLVALEGGAVRRVVTGEVFAGG